MGDTMALQAGDLEDPLRCILRAIVLFVGPRLAARHCELSEREQASSDYWAIG